MNLSKMCDFGFATSDRRRIRVVMVEMKSGTAKETALDQLKAGLDVMFGYLETSSPITAVAYVVVGYQAERFQRLLIAKNSRLAARGWSAVVRVRYCGGSIDI